MVSKRKGFKFWPAERLSGEPAKRTRAAMAAASCLPAYAWFSLFPDDSFHYIILLG